MKPQKQLYRHNPDEGIYGDCHRTAYAIVLGLDAWDVPHVFAAGRGWRSGNDEMDAWLLERGLKEVRFPCMAEALDHVIVSRAVQSPGIPYILGGQSRNNTNHSVAVLDEEIFDPSLDDSGIVGPCDDGFYWISYIVALPYMKQERPMPEPQNSRPMTEGEYCVGINFNPGGNPDVNDIKAAVARIIDGLAPIANDRDHPGARCASIAMTELESAAMWGVKALTKPKRD